MQVQPQDVFSLVAVVAVAASLLIWMIVAYRMIQGIPTLPYEPRRRVPWRGLELLVVFVVLEFPFLMALLYRLLPGPEALGSTATGTGEEFDVQHPIVDLLSADHSAGTWLLCGLLAVVVAPIVEEFTYRLLLQGWLEAEERQVRRRIAALRSLAPGVAPVLLVSLLFASRHFRMAGPPTDPDLAKQSMVVQALFSALTFVFALWLVRTRSGATAVDLGFVAEKFFADVRLGLVAFAAVAPPIILLQFVITEYVFPEDLAADPIPLFFLAVVLGTMYYRTHRIVPSIVLHMALNATSLALAWCYFAQ